MFLPDWLPSLGFKSNLFFLSLFNELIFYLLSLYCDALLERFEFRQIKLNLWGGGSALIVKGELAKRVWSRCVHRRCSWLSCLKLSPHQNLFFLPWTHLKDSLNKCIRVDSLCQFTSNAILAAAAGSTFPLHENGTHTRTHTVSLPLSKGLALPYTKTAPPSHPFPY